jgi:hypothetical protein
MEKFANGRLVLILGEYKWINKPWLYDRNIPIVKFLHCIIYGQAK